MPTNKQIEKLREMWPDENIDDIAGQLGIHRGTVYNWAKGLDLPSKKRGRPKTDWGKLKKVK